MASSPAGQPASPPKDWPFAAAHLPFFYGWAVWGLSTLGVLMSVPGQTIGIAVFTNIFIERLGLTRTELSTAYLIGTLGGAVFLTHAGKLYDRLGARIMVPSAAVLLGLVLVYLSGVDQLSAGIAAGLGLPLTVVAFPAITLGYFGVRMMGQGILFSASRNVMLVWFRRRLGLMSSLHGACVSMGFSASPLLLFAMISALGWRGTLWTLAITVGVVFATVAAVFLRNRPEDVGTGPDGVIVEEEQTRSAAEESESSARRRPVNATLAQARHDPLFWMFALALSINALFCSSPPSPFISCPSLPRLDAVPKKHWATFCPARRSP
jgi:sugar phosphate permease